MYKHLSLQQLLYPLLSTYRYLDIFDVVFTVTPGEGNGNPLQYSRLENSMDRGALGNTAHWVTKNWTRPSD